jgi:hypothetical protein
VDSQPPCREVAPVPFHVDVVVDVVVDVDFDGDGNVDLVDPR